MTEELQTAIVVQWLMDNQTYLKDLLAPVKNQKSELFKTQPIEFHDKIKEDYLIVARRIIIPQIALQTGCSNLIIMIVLGDLNLEEYIR